MYLASLGAKGDLEPFSSLQSYYGEPPRDRSQYHSRTCTVWSLNLKVMPQSQSCHCCNLNTNTLQLGAPSDCLLRLPGCDRPVHFEFRPRLRSQVLTWNEDVLQVKMLASLVPRSLSRSLSFPPSLPLFSYLSLAIFPPSLPVFSYFSLALFLPLFPSPFF